MASADAAHKKITARNPRSANRAANGVCAGTGLATGCTAVKAGTWGDSGVGFGVRLPWAAIAIPSTYKLQFVCYNTVKYHRTKEKPAAGWPPVSSCQAPQLLLDHLYDGALFLHHF